MQPKALLNWFEIPASDLDRAQLFYETVFSCKLIPVDYPHQMRIFPAGQATLGGAISQQADFYTPSANGVLIYFNANPDLQAILDNVVRAGGQVVVPKTKISDENGYIAIVLDCEGNRIGLQGRG